MNDKLEKLAKGQYGKILIGVLEGVMNEVADVRTIIRVKPEIENAVRMGIIQILQEKLVDKLKVLKGELGPPDPNEHL